MKTKMSRTKKALIILLCLPVLFLAGTWGYGALYDYLGGPAEMKLPVGTARILSPPMDVTVMVDGVEVPDARVFEMDESFNGKPQDSLVLWLPDLTAPHGREVIMVSRDRRKAGQGNESRSDYALWFGHFLVQADSGAWFIPFDDNIKGPGIDPRLEMDGDNISFFFSAHGKKPRRIEIEGKGD
jgi:hypothetical protein